MNKKFFKNIKFYFGRNIKFIKDQIIKPYPNTEKNNLNKQLYNEEIGNTESNTIRKMKGRKELFKSRDIVNEEMQPGTGKSNENNLERDNIRK